MSDDAKKQELTAQDGWVEDLFGSAVNLPVGVEQNDITLIEAGLATEASEETKRRVDRVAGGIASFCALSPSECDTCDREAAKLRPGPKWYKTEKLSTFSRKFQREEMRVAARIAREKHLEKLSGAYLPPSPYCADWAALLADGTSEVLMVSVVADKTGLPLREVFIRSREGMREEPEIGRLRFYHDEYGRMADHVQAQWSKCPESRGTLLGDRRAPAYVVNAFIERVLDECEVWDAQRSLRVEMSNRLVAEVRGALARRHLVLGAAGNPMLELIAASPTVATFCEEALILSPEMWIESAVVFAAYLGWCQRRKTVPDDEVPFFRQLRTWGGDGVRPQKRTAASGRRQGYVGLALRVG